MTAPIVIVTGIQAAGKTTVGRLLAARFERGAFIEADAFQHMIVAGAAPVTERGVPTGEPARQLRLRLRNACQVARAFAEAGFAAVVDDIVVGERWDHVQEDLAGLPFTLVVLAPRVDVVVEERDPQREKRTIGVEWAEYLDVEMHRTMAGVGIWVDNSDQRPEETVDEILDRLGPTWTVAVRTKR